MIGRIDRSDAEAVEQFRNFLSWGVKPGPPGPRPVPPAWYAYALGITTHCPPRGTL